MVAEKKVNSRTGPRFYPQDERGNPRATEAVRLRDLRVEVLPVAALRLHANNPRTHSVRQVRKIADSIRKFGFTNPILIDRDGYVVAGHGRLKAAELLGLTDVPTIRLDQMTEVQKRAYIIADNKLAEAAGWDRERLAAEFKCISELASDFDLTITGFEAAQIEILLQDEHRDGGDDDPDNILPIDKISTPVSRPGDLWTLGEHRVVCADPRVAESYDRLLEGARADMVFVNLLGKLPFDDHNPHGESDRKLLNPWGSTSERELMAFIETVMGHLRSTRSPLV